MEKAQIMKRKKNEWTWIKEIEKDSLKKKNQEKEYKGEKHREVKKKKHRKGSFYLIVSVMFFNTV